MSRRMEVERQFKEVGGRVRTRRKSLGLRIVDLSLISGLTTASISNIERGTRDVRLSKLLDLATALRMEPWRLFVGSGHENGMEVVAIGGSADAQKVSENGTD